MIKYFLPIFLLVFFSFSHPYSQSQKEKQKVEDKLAVPRRQSLHPCLKQDKPPNSTISDNLLLLYTVREYPNSCFNQMT